jgi:hypothetical protein
MLSSRNHEVVTHAFNGHAARGRETGANSRRKAKAMRTYHKNTERQTLSVPNWTAILTQAVNTPGMMMEAYSAFHDYSVGNQLLALVQCHLRGITPGPIKTFPGWQSLGRNVKRGERALVLCMPITRRRRDAGASDDDEGDTYTAFVYRPRWFVLSQTEGEEMPPLTIPQYDQGRALEELGIERVEFDITDGNCQGFARGRQVAINPVARLPHKSFFHEAAHVVLGHTAEGDFTDTVATPRSLREVEAEAVALLCCESLGLEGAEYCRGYIQHWLKGDVIPEQSAQKVMRAADRILRAGRERTGDVG